jgi:dTDP-4-dehydrorhamnose reductase
VSTDYVFDGRKAGPLVETDPVGPLSAYGRSKLAGEEAVKATVPAWTIVRSQSIYGAGKKSFVDAILARAASGAPLTVVTDQRVSPTWAEHLAEALRTLVAGGQRGIFHVSNSGSCTWFECARAALDMGGFGETEIQPITAASLGRPAPRPANSEFSCARYERETGATLPPWRVALQGYLATRAAVKEAS